MQWANKKNISIITGLLLFFLFVLTVANLWYRSKEELGLIIASDVAHLTDILKEINKTVGIIDFDYQKNNIDFLNVRSFTGSEIGSMDLEHPDRWKGPYIKDNPTVQKKAYQVVKTFQGYFVAPGEGVKLPNGKIVGTDIPLDEVTDIPPLTQEGGPLNYQGKPLALPLPLTKELLPLQEAD